MTKLFLDTEFNGLGGELISLALVAEDGREWYGVRDLPEDVNPWVREHVLPFLDGAQMDADDFTDSLLAFLVDFNDAEIVADWPADFEHLAAQMTDMGAAHSFNMPIECTMRLIITPELHPTIPHNALSDARALRDWYMGQLT